MPPSRKSTFATGTAQLRTPSVVVKASHNWSRVAGMTVECCKTRLPSGPT
jgi:hypothetical protein